ncbi:hypothetical protein GPROT2_03184 [Gammaproteobacteria bacterium]|nr:hypothetical protein GPROT2_03184 [Gammaproteobacteria bacterium]
MRHHDRWSAAAAMLRFLMPLAAAALLGACAGSAPPVTAGQAVVDYDLVLDPAAAPVRWNEDVKPVLEGRCVVCHACYDAPCQLKLSSWEGLDRGANPGKVYDGARIRAAAPTRLYIDAHTPAQWQAKGFHPVMSPAAATAAGRMEQSVLYRMLRLKQLHPQPLTGMLPGAVTTGLDREQVCTTEDGFDDFARDNPLWGMPYGLPNLGEAEYRKLVRWIATGAPPPPAARPSPAAQEQIAGWERFLNGSTPRERLMSRYLYEHLFIGHLHLAGTGDREFYRLVRSRTPPGLPIEEIPTVRPLDDPGTSFWYRLWLDPQSIVAKDHIVYEWSAARMARYTELFLATRWDIAELPGYTAETAGNPLLTFAAIPMDSRYRFLLDDARYFIEGFIKGPVCRGQVALNVIDDRFWVLFLSPDHLPVMEQAEFIAQNAAYLRIPADRGTQTLNVASLWTEYWKGQKTYIEAKQRLFASRQAVPLDAALAYIWDGAGSNPNAALTIFRHTDSAFVMNGLVGDYPKTAWVIDYPLLERIHYLLVAGFDVYGNVGHQLLTRIYMDFLRMEGEDYFLAFLPASHRRAIRDSWYLGIRERRQEQFSEPLDWLSVESVTGYQGDDPQRELYRRIEQHLGPLAGHDDINRCGTGCALLPADNTVRARVEEALRRISALRGRQLLPLPDASFLRVRTGADPAGDLAYTLVLNKDYRNLVSMLEDEDRRNPDHDSLTVVPGFAASYPNFFLDVDAAGIDAFVARFAAIRDRDAYERFVALYGLRRTNPGFWAQADWFQAAYRRLQPLEAGIFDLNRYENR